MDGQCGGGGQQMGVQGRREQGSMADVGGGHPIWVEQDAE